MESFNTVEAVKAIKEGETITVSPRELSMILNSAYKAPEKCRYIVDINGEEINISIDER